MGKIDNNDQIMITFYSMRQERNGQIDNNDQIMITFF